MRTAIFLLLLSLVSGGCSTTTPEDAKAFTDGIAALQAEHDGGMDFIVALSQSIDNPDQKMRVVLQAQSSKQKVAIIANQMRTLLARISSINPDAITPYLQPSVWGLTPAPGGGQ